ncbi:hypothetical protein [Mesorhizobium xinjiangense]|uniref:hypothetical protein n=1 Tax=Mesorhizobium xinjiangense TaxID=2678685 RepID=UPI0012EE862E|nr:hypothetical protein [Mesorhizobium xinjiangense]
MRNLLRAPCPLLVGSLFSALEARGVIAVLLIGDENAKEGSNRRAAHACLFVHNLSKSLPKITSRPNISQYG